MVEPLSEPIRTLLRELRLCSARDLRRCWRLVRRLTCDLPSFDSVWIDALVHMGRLTPYQARLLESANPASIRIGPCVVVGRLGAGPFGQTLLARPADGRELCVVKQLSATERLSTETVERLEHYLAAAAGFSHPSLVVPNSCFHVDDQRALVSRYVPGPHLGELVVRRGRFPAAVVWEIGRQLADALAALVRRGLTHGDIRAANVRLTSAGTAVLVDAGIRQILDPVLTMHSGLAPERYDGIAPELIGVGGKPGPATDAYALGCLLWQLLAGRPPFPGGDPLVKLAAHQTRSIDDVRKLAPDTPVELARAIQRLTARDPTERPQQFSELLAFWGLPTRRGRRALADFRRRFDAPARSRAGRRVLSSPTRWLFVAATLFAVSGGVAMLVNQGARSVALSWAAELSQKFQEATIGPSATRSDRPDIAPTAAGGSRFDFDSYAPLPAPDRHGVLHLDSPGPYRARDVTVVGALAIEGAENMSPTIAVDGQPLKLCAETVRLKNVRIVARSQSARDDRPRESNLRALLRIESQSLEVEGCLFDSGVDSAVSESPKAADDSKAIFAPPTGPALIAWKLIDAADRRGGTAKMRNAVLLGDGPALYLANAVRQITCDNVLKAGSGPLVQLAPAPLSKSTLTLKLTHCTARASGAVIRWVVPTDEALSSGTGQRRRGAIRVEANDCVFDLASPHAALFELAGPEPRPDWLPSLQMTGEGSVTSPTLEVAAWISTQDGRLTPLDAAPVELEGLIAGDFHFAGSPARQAADSEVHDSQAPRRSASPPGIRASALPGP